MPEEPSSDNTNKSAKTQFTMEDLERVLPEEHRRQTFLKLIGQLEEDRPAVMLLKGHLVLEEKLAAIIGKFVFHGEVLENARLTFAQKMSVARSLSLDEHNNTVWGLIEKLNKLRNILAHSLGGASRQDAMNALKSAYSAEHNLEAWEKNDESLLIFSVVAYSLGFLDGFEQEVERFKKWVQTIDVAVNPHRHCPAAKTSDPTNSS